MNKKLPKLKKDPEFQKLELKLSHEEYERLEKSIIANGCFSPIHVWKGYIIDGYYRYEICQKHGIGFKTKTIVLRSKEEVISWICSRHLNKQNIPEETRRYLIGRRYEAEKKSDNKNISDIGQNMTDEMERKPHIGKVSVKLGHEYHVSRSTVSRYFRCTKALDRLNEEIPGIAGKITDGKIKISQDNLIKLAKKPTEEILRVLENSCRRKATEKKGKQIFEAHITDADFQFSPKGTVKDMPAFDPDVYVSSLILTIPSWISMIKRTAENSHAEMISRKAKKDLICALDELISISIDVKKQLEEQKNGRLFDVCTEC